MTNKVVLQQIKETLLAQKKELMEKSYQSIDIDVDGDETDEIQGNLLLHLASQLSSRDSLKLKQINDALQKIEELTYGICEDCEEQIPDKRLLANPYFLNCVTCAEEKEKEARQRRRF